MLMSRPHRTEQRERERSRPAEWILFTPIIFEIRSRDPQPSWRAHSYRWSLETTLVSENFWRRMGAPFSVGSLRNLRTSLEMSDVWLWIQFYAWRKNSEAKPMSSITGQTFFSFLRKGSKKLRTKKEVVVTISCWFPVFFSISLQVIFNYIEYIMVYVTNKILNVESEMPHTCTADNAQSWHTCRFDTN